MLNGVDSLLNKGHNKQQSTSQKLLQGIGQGLQQGVQKLAPNLAILKELPSYGHRRSRRKIREITSFRMQKDSYVSVDKNIN